MKNLICNVLFALFTFVQIANAAHLTQEQQEATAFIQKMYSYSAELFEFSELQGKHEPDRHCLLMEDFFVKKLISRPEKNQGCEIGTRRYIRYPGVDDIELSESKKQGKMPRPKLSIPLIEGDKAWIEATSKYGKTIYFLIRTAKGFRIENALYYEKIPTEVNVCHGQFLKEPTPDQLKFRPECKDY